MQDNNTNVTDIDETLKHLGTFGNYQKKRWIVFIILVWSLAIVEFGHVFITVNPNYRCLIPNCETADNTEYKPIWLNNAVPFKENKPLTCKRYQVKNDSIPDQDTCDSDLFNNQIIEDCNEFVFDTNHRLIVHDFNILCDRVWMLALPGTAHFVGLFISLPISGYIADRIGRRRVIIFGLMLATIINLIKSFSVSIWMFVVCEFLQSFSASGVFTSIFTLILELLETDKRVFSGTISFFWIAIGEISVAALAWKIQTWSVFLRIISIPSFLVIVLAPYIPESIRWLISQNKINEANIILESIAKENGTELTEKLKLKHVQVNSNALDETHNETLKDVLMSVPIIIRVITCAFCWMTCTFVYYGLILTSGGITGNRYLNFILVATVEIPASFLSYFSCQYLGRKRTISSALIIVGICCGSYIFISSDHWSRLIMFLLGKCGITTALGSLYIITAEMYPTPFRQTLMGICSMLGRIGSMLAPQMPILAIVWNSLPILIFGLVSIIAGLLSLTFPETLNSPLPRTIEEAVNIGKKNEENTKL